MAANRQAAGGFWVEEYLVGLLTLDLSEGVHCFSNSALRSKAELNLFPLRGSWPIFLLAFVDAVR